MGNWKDLGDGDGDGMGLGLLWGLVVGVWMDGGLTVLDCDWFGCC